MTSNLRHVMTVGMLVAISIVNMEAGSHNTVIADSTACTPLPGASLFDCNGNVIGMCDAKGRFPYIPATSYPVTVRYLGFKEKIVTDNRTDTIFLQEIAAELPEVVVESRSHKMLHMLAYVREYSTLSTYTDTVQLFREKMVDYMLPADKTVRFIGWSIPRILKSRSYYRFTDSQGTDSVSSECNQHFSWSDWIGVTAPPELPRGLTGMESSTDTLRGKYGIMEVWTKNASRVSVDVDVLADTTSRKWVPNLSVFFRNRLDFDRFNVRFNYGNVAGDSIAPMDLTGYSFNIESNGRGHPMFMFNRVDEPFFVNTYAEVYIIDKEYVTIKEAKKWERLSSRDLADLEIYEATEAPELQPSTLALIHRVNNIDNGQVRLALTPDARLGTQKVVKPDFGKRVLQLFKTVTGISHARASRKRKQQWREFRHDVMRENNSRGKPQSPREQ
ncbi:hypothetical protein [uncultured Muribaculum sp.]|uniref:hypothetical protein n=1 Tax=uncultured Muribaculum sp. TaxID=1918613 RepID=UPI0025DAD6F3|nr:hypothetical protein [uncultured Muribaculum sp.]